MTFTVRPAASGGWLALASGPLLLVTPPTDQAFLVEAWAGVQGESGFQSALDLLTRGGLGSTPPFVLVEWSEGSDARIIVRGEAALTVMDAGGSRTISAAGVSTWTESTVAAVTGIQLAVPGAAGAGELDLPFASGVALVASIGSDGIAPAPVAEPVEAPAPLAEPVEAPAPLAEPVEAPKPAEAPAPVAAPAPAPDVDIEATRREMPEQIDLPPAKPEAAEADGDDYSYLFGDTMFRGVADAAVHPAEEPSEDGSEPVDDALHDGETVMTADIAKLRGKRRPRQTAPPPPPAARPVLVISTTGAREPLDQPVLVGRSPSVSKVSGTQVPRLITVGTADQDISRNHAQFELQGGAVVVTDLNSRNGTSIELPGRAPQKLRAGEATTLIPGTVVDLGSGVTITVEEDE